MVRRSAVTAGAIWVGVGWIMAAACVLLAVDPVDGRWALMLAAGAILTASAALAVHVHCWLRTVASLVRMCAREDERPNGLRAVP